MELDSGTLTLFGGIIAAIVASSILTVASLSMIATISNHAFAKETLQSDEENSEHSQKKYLGEGGNFQKLRFHIEDYANGIRRSYAVLLFVISILIVYFVMAKVLWAPIWIGCFSIVYCIYVIKHVTKISKRFVSTQMLYKSLN